VTVDNELLIEKHTSLEEKKIAGTQKRTMLTGAITKGPNLFAESAETLRQTKKGEIDA